MRRDLLELIRRGLRKPPRVIAQRVWSELKTESDRVLVGWRHRTGRQLAQCEAKARRLAPLWEKLARRAYVAPSTVDVSVYDHLLPHSREKVIAAADIALAHQIQVLGSGPIELGDSIDWHRDYKTGHRWPLQFAQRMTYVNPDDASDVKIPWEISRLQWLIPAGQAYQLTGDEKYAQGVREVLAHWIRENPYAYSVNWACTMEVALRIVDWTWLFHTFHASAAWADPTFRGQFLASLYEHGTFTERYLERADINGNHYTANATGLIFAGLFFGDVGDAPRWQRLGWLILEDEFPKQVYSDGVDFEASIPYHRLVLELFLLPAIYRKNLGLPVPAAYRDRLVAMARFTKAYSRSSGSVPLWGDADDGRALPFGLQDINDHRYLLGLVGVVFETPDLYQACSGSHDEVFWLLGAEACRKLPPAGTDSGPVSSQAFSEGGFYVMRNDRDHVFVDCGPVGLAGRGGHGHNDCLSLEVVLQDTPLIADCGTYVYTASFADRNHFRSTASHNTPCVNRQEINRFVRWDNLWGLHNDARPEVLRWSTGPRYDQFTGRHSGYRRFEIPLSPLRTIVLDHDQHAVLIADKFESPAGQSCDIEIPLHLAPKVTVERIQPQLILLTAGNQHFALRWHSDQDWKLETGTGRISPSYGVCQPCIRLAWKHQGSSDAALLVWIAPLVVADECDLQWARKTLRQAESQTDRLDSQVEATRQPGRCASGAAV